MKRHIIILAISFFTLCCTRTMAASDEKIIVADFSQSLGEWNNRPGSRLSTVMGQWECCPAVVDAIDKLNLSTIRVWLRMNDLYNVETKKSEFKKRKMYIERWRALSDTLLVNWVSNYELCEGVNPMWSYQELFDATVEALVYFKTLAPSIAYVECENEMYDADMVKNYTRYKFMYKVIKAVNGKKLPGGEIKIGGPVTSNFSEYFFKKWLDLYKNDTNPDKRLDFIAYHEYLFKDKDNVAVIKNQRQILDKLLVERGIPSLPAYVTENGIFQTDKKTELGFEADLHVQAAAMASMHFYFENQRQIYPFHWTLIHPDNGRKNMFVEVKKEGVQRPYYLMMLMQSMLPKTRVQSSDFLNEKGLGLGSLAAIDDNKVAVFTWNYQWDNVGEENTVKVTIDFKNLPEKFSTDRVRVEQYFVADDKHEGGLVKTKDEVLRSVKNREYVLPVVHKPNTLQITTLTAILD